MTWDYDKAEYYLWGGGRGGGGEGGRGGGGGSGPFWTVCVNTILKEMGPFSALSKWHEWINVYSKLVSYIMRVQSVITFL